MTSHRRVVDTSQHPGRYRDPLVTALAGLLVLLATSSVVLGVQILSSRPVASQGHQGVVVAPAVVSRGAVHVAPAQKAAPVRVRVAPVHHVAHHVRHHSSHRVVHHVVHHNSHHGHGHRHHRHSHGHHERHCGHHRSD